MNEDKGTTGISLDVRKTRAEHEHQHTRARFSCDPTPDDKESLIFLISSYLTVDESFVLIISVVALGFLYMINE